MKQQDYKTRGFIISGAIGLVMLILIIRLYSIQVLTDRYEDQAKIYARKTKFVMPPRGNIYARTSSPVTLYVSNKAVFDLTVTPRELYIPDTAVFCRALGMSRSQLRAALAEMNNPRREHILKRYIDPVEYGRLREQLYGVQGISFNSATQRYYLHPTGANFLGYISEVNRQDIEASEGFFQSGDLKGKGGIESSYEDSLHGVKGRVEVLKDNYGREVGSYADGRENVPAQRGSDLLLGIDIELQRLGEELMQNKRGSIVAIEPQTGEILAFVSSPTYNPNELTGKGLQQNWRRLNRDPKKPLFNRPLMAEYPPGSIYKTALALAALDAGVIQPNTYYSCGGGFWRNRGKPGCRMHPHPLKLDGAIQYSCNSYFSAVYMDFLQHRQYDSIYEAFDTWSDYMDRLGLGRELGVDLPSERDGLLPSTQRYDRIYGHNRWGATTIISNAIGQGEILMTPLQMANLVAIIANQGEYVPPHFVKATRSNEAESFVGIYRDRYQTGIDREHFEAVTEGMYKVVSIGTARRAIIEGVEVCGKTGTVENPHGEDHATFIGFAPRINPRIAIAVVIENSGGGGGRWAAPTAAVMMEYYLTRQIEHKKFEYERVRTANFIDN